MNLSQKVAVGVVTAGILLGTITSGWLSQGQQSATPKDTVHARELDAPTGKPASGTASAAESKAPDLATATTKVGARPDLKNPDSFWQAFSEARLRVQDLTEREAAMPQNQGVKYFAANPGQQITARFMENGVKIQSGLGGDWQTTVSVTGLSRGDKAAAELDGAAPAASGTRVQYQRGGVTEWFENRQEGFEHGFTIAEKPAAGSEGSLRVDLKFAGMRTRSDAAGQSVKLSRTDGTPVLSYSKLKVWDASGRVLDSRMEANSDAGQVSILVADSGANYPITIDPIIASEEQKLGPEVTGNGSSEDEFGYAVALDLNTAVIGAPQDDTPAGIDAGSAYVFFRTAATWTLQKYLKANDATENSGFGAAVAVDGDTAVIGAFHGFSTPVGSQSPQSVVIGGGKAYVFVRNNSNWTFQWLLQPPSSTSSFGYAVAVDGNTALVGDPGNDQAIVFTRTGTAWTQQAVISVGESGTGFGEAVSLSGNSALIGASFGGSGSGTGTLAEPAQVISVPTGAAYVLFVLAVPGASRWCGLESRLSMSSALRCRSAVTPRLLARLMPRTLPVTIPARPMCTRVAAPVGLLRRSWLVRTGRMTTTSVQPYRWIRPAR